MAAYIKHVPWEARMQYTGIVPDLMQPSTYGQMVIGGSAGCGCERGASQPKRKGA
jgi:hypothetical protein